MSYIPEPYRSKKSLATVAAEMIDAFVAKEVKDEEKHRADQEYTRSTKALSDALKVSSIPNDSRFPMVVKGHLVTLETGHGFVVKKIQTDFSSMEGES